ncbi:hypothetical protein TSOC_014830, partial [Tetrabaena socialis]
ESDKDGEGRRLDIDDPYLKAADNCDIHTLACLRRLGCPWLPLNRKGGTFSYALRQDCRLPVLRWLLELGCPVDWRSAKKSTEYRDDDAFSWLKEEQRRREMEVRPQQQ